MTKKHFIALADALRAEKPGTNWDPNKMVQWELDVKAIANVCAAQNSNFNRERWLGYIAGTNGPSGKGLQFATPEELAARQAIGQVAEFGPLPCGCTGRLGWRCPVCDAP